MSDGPATGESVTSDDLAAAYALPDADNSGSDIIAARRGQNPEAGNSGPDDDDNPGNNTPEPDIPSPEGGPHMHEIRRGGSNERIQFSADLREQMRARLQDRAGVAQDLARDDQRLGMYDKMLVQALEGGGPNIIDKIAGNEALTANDIALAWAIIYDELDQKTAATGRDVSFSEAVKRLESSRFSALQNIPLLRRLHKPAKSEDNAGAPQVTDSHGPQLESAYMRQQGFRNWSAERQINDLLALNELRINMEKALGLKAAPEDWARPDFQRKTGHRIQDAVVDRIDAILRREHDGASYAELSAQDPVRAAQVRHEAVRQGVMTYADEAAKEFLKADAPAVSRSKIDAHIAEFDKQPDAHAERDREKKLAKAKTEATKAKTALESAEKKLSDLKASRDKLREDLEKARDAVELETQKYNNLSTGLIARIEQLRNEIPPRPARPGDKATEAERRDYEAEMDRIRRMEEELTNKDNTLKELIGNKASAEAQQANAQRRYDTLTSSDDTEEGSIKHAEQALKDAENKVTQTEHEQEQLEHPTLDTDRAERKLGLEMWRDVIPNYEQILDIQFSQRGFEAKYTRAAMADTEVQTVQEDRVAPDGTHHTRDVEVVAGAELIREHIFGEIDPSFNTMPAKRALAREMLSDQAIADALIWTFRIDRATLPPDIYEQDLLREVLPRIKHATRAEIGDAMRFMITEGLRSAEKGDPILTVAERYHESTPELQMSASAILAENQGRTEMSATEQGLSKIVWEGKLKNIVTTKEAFLEGLNLDEDTELNFRIGEIFNRGQVGAMVSVEVNEQFLQSLPDRIDADTQIADILRFAFYDTQGRLRTKLLGNEPERLRAVDLPRWLPIAGPEEATLGPRPNRKFAAPIIRRVDPAEGRGRRVLGQVLGREIGLFWQGGQRSRADFGPNTPRIYEESVRHVFVALEDRLSTQTAEKFAAATTNEVLEMSPAERLKVVRAFQPVEVNMQIPDPDNPKLMLTAHARVTFNNRGEFFIHTNKLPPMELNAFYERMLEEEPATSADEREDFRNIFQRIQQGVGFEILRSQQKI